MADTSPSGRETRECWSGSSPLNRVYYAADLAAAERVIDALESGGRESMELLAQGDPGLRAQWQDLSQNGFFRAGDTDPLPYCEVTLEVAEDSDVRRSARMAVSLADALLQLLDRAHFTLRYEYPIDSGDGPDPLARRFLDDLEEAGVVPPYRIGLSSDLVANRDGHAALADRVEALHHECPNREMDLVTEYPDRFASVKEVDAYHDALAALFAVLYKIDGDPAILSCFRRYIHGVLLHRFAASRLFLRPQGGRFQVRSESCGTPMLTGARGTDGIRETMESLDKQVAADTGLPTCRECPFVFVCDKSLLDRFVRSSTVADEMLTDRVFERECGLHKEMLDCVFEDLIRLGARSTADGPALKFDITEDKELVFSPLYPEGAETSAARSQTGEDALT